MGTEPKKGVFRIYFVVMVLIIVLLVLTFCLYRIVNNCCHKKIGNFRYLIKIQINHNRCIKNISGLQEKPYYNQKISIKSMYWKTIKTKIKLLIKTFQTL